MLKIVLSCGETLEFCNDLLKLTVFSSAASLRANAITLKNV